MITVSPVINNSSCYGSDGCVGVGESECEGEGGGGGEENENHNCDRVNIQLLP